MINEVPCEFEEPLDWDEAWSDSLDYDQRTEDEHNQLQEKKGEPLEIMDTHVNGVLLPTKFENIAYSGFEKICPNLGVGDFIFRPSINEVDHLTLSWKVDVGLVRHIDIKQDDEGGDLPLWVNGLWYRDLNAIADIYIPKMVNLVRDVVNNPCYRNIDWEDEDALVNKILAMPAAEPNRKPYYFAHFLSYPSHFLMVSLYDGKIFYSRFKVTSEGLRIGKQMVFDSVLQMTEYCDEKLHEKSFVDRAIEKQMLQDNIDVAKWLKTYVREHAEDQADDSERWESIEKLFATLLRCVELPDTQILVL